jgi:hypothetical protein
LDEQVLSPQHRFLLAAAAPDTFSRDERSRVAAGLASGWEELLELALRNRVASPAFILLGSDPFGRCVPDEIAEKWRSANRAVAFLNGVARKQLAGLAAVLTGAQIAPLLYKGLDFAVRYYSNPRFRAFRDIDLIVGTEEVLQADSALRVAGYRPLRDRMPLEYYRRFHLHAEYEHPRWPLPVELHWALDSPYAAAPVDLESIRRRAAPAPDLGPGVLRPAALDALALMAIHLKKHLALAAELSTPHARLAAVIGEGGLIWVLDVVAWMRADAASHGEASVLRRIGELGADEALRVSLRLARDLDETALPDWARAAGEHVPERTSLLCRLVYPELSSGRRGSAIGRWLASLLRTPVSGLVFRPIRILESIAPPRTSGASESRAWRLWSTQLARIGRLGTANLAAIARFKLQKLRDDTARFDPARPERRRDRNPPSQERLQQPKR